MIRRRTSTRGPRLLLTTQEERFPRASAALMSGAFPILLLNSAFGLLPSTLVGPNLTYARCSLAQLYAVVFGLAILVLSAVFVPVILTKELSKETNGTGVAVVVLTKLTHVGGFLLLLVRGHFVARRLPGVWTAAARLVERAGLVKRRSLLWAGLLATATYAALMAAFQLDLFGGQLRALLPSFLAFYAIPPAPSNVTLISAGYVIWSLVSFSHVLVSILAAYLLHVALLALRSLNASLLPLLTRPHLLLSLPPSKPTHHSRRPPPTWTSAAPLVKDVLILAEELVGALSSTLGVSLIIEVLILIANMLVDIFYLLVNIRPPSHATPTNSSFTYDPDDNPRGGVMMSGGGLVENFGPGGSNSAFRLITEAAIHFVFFYQLCCTSTHVVHEAGQTLRMLKTVRPSDVKGRRARRAVEEAKGDLASANLSLTAANYFAVNKFLLTSVSGALTTYIIVLLQFNAQDGV